MPRNLTDTQLSNLDETATRPVFFMVLNHSGAAENLAQGDDLVYDTDPFTGGSFRNLTISDSETASFELPQTDARIMEVTGGTWRGGTCIIYAVAALPGDDRVYTTAEAIEVLNGSITSSEYTGRSILVRATHSNNAARRTPRYTYDEICDHIPAAGTILSWEGDELILTAPLSPTSDDYTSNSSLAVGGRLTAQQLKDLSNKTGPITSTAAGAPISIVYGKVPVAGKIFAIGSISGDLVVGVAWCVGEINSIDAYISDAAVPVGVTQTDYLGTTTQTTDSTLSSAITAYNDNLVLETPDGDVGIAYSVFRISTGDLSTAPTFKAIIEGRKVYDPRTPATAYSDNSALCAADLVENAIFGMGVDALGVSDCADYADELIDGSNERARIALEIKDAKRTANYLDLLCNYAECVWFSEGSDIRLKPDRISDAQNPSGKDTVTNGSFDSDSDWTKGTGWSITGGAAVCDGTQVSATTLGQTITTEAGIAYALEIDITRTAGTLSVEIDAVEVLSETATGTYNVEIEPATTTTSLDIIGDASFTGTVTYITVKRLYYRETRYVAGSLRITPTPDDDVATSVRCRYTDPVTSDPNWNDVTTSPVRLPGVDTGAIPAKETTLSYRGVYRAAEALNKANQVLQRNINPVTYRWQTADHGIRFLKADVVELDVPTIGLSELVWVESVRMVNAGRYQVTGLRYDPGHYPDELPSTTGGTIPVGAIVLLDGTTVPSGWALYSTADGNAIMGAGGTYAVGDTGGSDTYAGWSGNVSTSDGHDSSLTLMKIEQGVFGTGSALVFTATGPTSGATHTHTYSTDTIAPNPYRRENILIQKTGSTTTTFPKEAMTLGLPGINTINRARITTYAGRLLEAAAASANAGASSKTVNMTTGATSYNHTHWVSTLTSSREIGDETGPLVLHNEATGGGSHTHNFSLTLSRKIKRVRVALYGGTDDYPLAPGDIVLWAGSLVSLPTDWYLCDGNNGTEIDLTDHFIEIAAVGNENTVTGDNTIALSGNSDSHSHDHSASTSTTPQTYVNVHHSNAVTHSHSINDSASWTPPYYALAAIMYIP